VKRYDNENRFSRDGRRDRTKLLRLQPSIAILAAVCLCVVCDDDDWVKKSMEYEVQGPRPRGRPNRAWREVVREDCQARKMNEEDAVDRCKWRKMIKDVR